jgi:prevent-host-death family protein
MSKSSRGLDLDVDLEGGVVPISKAASSLAALLKRSKERKRPIIVTQKGYPTGVLLPVSLYTALRELAQREIESGASELADVPANVERAVSALPDLTAAVAGDPSAELDLDADEADEADESGEPRRGRRQGKERQAGG